MDEDEFNFCGVVSDEEEEGESAVKIIFRNSYYISDTYVSSCVYKDIKNLTVVHATAVEGIWDKTRACNPLEKPTRP